MGIRLQIKCIVTLMILLSSGYPVFAKTSDTPQLLINAESLKEKLQLSEVVIVDVRRLADYESGHLENAVSIPIETLFSSGSRRDLVITLNEARNIFSNAGIDQQTEVIIYDNGSFIDAARAFWVLELYGLKRLMLLDGGFPSWVKRNYLVTKIAPVVKPKQFIPTVVPGRLSTKLTVQMAVNQSNATIIDARPAIEYTGKKIKFSRGGHIPNAINIPAVSNYKINEGETRLWNDERLNHLYSSIDQDKNVIVYCNKGKESALSYFVLRKLGFNVSAYDGSWYEWGNDPNLPVVNDQ